MNKSKIMILFSFVLFLISSFFINKSQAKIENNYDSFEEITTFCSTFTDNKPFCQVRFSKIIKKNLPPPGYALYFFIITEQGSFSKEPIKYKVDDDQQIYELEVLNTYEKIRATNKIVGVSVLIGNNKNSNFLVLLKKSQKMKFRISLEDSSDVDWELPNNTLKEWKQIVDIEG